MASTSTSSHLSYPAPEAPEGSTSTQRAPSPPLPVLLKNRLYVGNLHPTVDEYTLIQVFSKFGKLARLDYLFHKTGALRGKPRGYAFVEYTGERDAAVALEAANGKALRGRHITVTYAHQAPLDAHHPASRRTLPQHQQQDSGRSTTLSLLKSAPSHARTRSRRWRQSYCNSLRHQRRRRLNMQRLHTHRSQRSLGLRIRNRPSRRRYLRYLHLVSSPSYHAHPNPRRRHCRCRCRLSCAQLHLAKVMRCSKA
ncbi:hypothetical protein EDB87DRAFT_490845 [Lactarius vividus]|nr:hypothetical protein EDB87DRAFT_490845 [Lactarius vividus]